jgi:hypothetical protein
MRGTRQFNISQLDYDEEYLELCLHGLYDLMALKEAIFRYRRNYKQYNLCGKYKPINENYREEEDPFIEAFDTLYDKYATMIQENKNYQNKSEMRIVIKAIMSILVLYSSLVENKEFERVFYERIMNLEPLLILINDMKSEFQTILFGYAETANAAHSPVIGTHASLNEINLNEPEVTNEFSYPVVRTIHTSGYRFRSQLLPKNGVVTYQLEATNVLPFKLEKRKIKRSRKVPKFRKPTKANKNTKKLRELIKERKAKSPLSHVKNKSVKTISMKRLGIKI